MASMIARSRNHGAASARRSVLPILRRLFAVLLIASVFAAAMQHLGYGFAAAGEGPGIMLSAVDASPSSAPDDDLCIPGHCHCLCHAATQFAPEPVSKPFRFAGAVYTGRDVSRPWSVSVGPPFEPPCA
jgi:hypothetical protein